MQQTVVLAGATDQSVLVRADTISTGAPNESITNATSGLQIRYKRGATGAVTTVSPASQTSTGAHTDGGIVHLHGGVYRVDLPDAAFASGVPWVVITLAGVSDTRFTVAMVDISAGDPRAANINANVTQWRGTEPNTLVSGRVDASVGAMAANVVTATAIASNAITDAKIASNAITAAKIATDAITADKIAANAIGASELAADAVTEIQSGLATASALATVDTELGTLQSDATAIKAKTDSLTFTVANVLDANVQRINDVTITGDGSAGDKFDVV